MTGLDVPMQGDGCRAELFCDHYRDALKAACAEDSEIWQVYANNFGPDGFDDSIALYRSTSCNRTFVLFEGDELAGMSSYPVSTRTAACSKSAAPIIAPNSAAPASTGGSKT